MLFCSLTAGGTQAPLIVLALALESGKFVSIWDWQWCKKLCGDVSLPSVGSLRSWEKETGGIVRCCSGVSDFGVWLSSAVRWEPSRLLGCCHLACLDSFLFLQLFLTFFPQRILWDKQQTTEYKGFCAVSSAKHLLASQSITSHPFCPLYWSPTETLCFALEIVFMLG